jgi:hypothetical protein
MHSISDRATLFGAACSYNAAIADDEKSATGTLFANT